jgi:hypothetical protein
MLRRHNPSVVAVVFRHAAQTPSAQCMCSQGNDFAVPPLSSSKRQQWYFRQRSLRIFACSVQALAPAPGELTSATTSSQQTRTPHAGRWPSRPRGVSPRLRPSQAQVRTSGDFSSSSTASNVRALCSGSDPGRLQNGAADGTSAGAFALNFAR